MTDKFNLIETIAKEDKFSTFSRLLGTSGANAAFSTPGQFTVFVPTNDAFGKIPDAKMNELLNETNQTKLKSLLTYHIMPGKVMASTLGAMMIRASSTGEDLAFSDNGGLKVNGAGVQARNIEATNGVIHQLDTVLTPPPKAAAAPPAPAGPAAAVTAEASATPPAPPPPAPVEPHPPTTFTVGVTDVMFNPTNAIFGRLLKTHDGKVVTLGYWQQKDSESREDTPYFDGR